MQLSLNNIRNIRLILSWSGEKFSGYQYQPHAITIQETLNQAWKILTRESVTLYGCSRLDAEVHAFRYVLNLHTHTLLNCDRILRGLNGILHNQLKANIALYHCEDAPSDFHARFHTLAKHYRYLIWFGFSEHALLTKRCWRIHTKTLLKSLPEIFKQFEGEHDFLAFRASDCSAKNTIKKIHQIDVWQHPLLAELIIVDIWGSGFLKNMIRNMIGTAIQMAHGKLSETTITDAYIHKNRERVGMCAPAWALTLMQVFYQEEDLIKDLQLQARYLTPF